MTQAEYKRSHNAGRRKMAVVTLLVLVLCLACFALGIMVGGSGPDGVAEDTSGKASVSATVREAPGSRATVSDSERVESEQTIPQAKHVAEQKQASDIRGSGEIHADVKKQAQTQEAVVQEVPLGSGINPRKNAVAKNGATGSREVVPETGSEPQVTPDTASKKSPPAPAPVAEQKQSPSAAQMSAAKEGKYVVQTASFRAEADARALAQKLKPEFPAYVREVDLGEKGVWFRVLVGPWAHRDEADESRRRVKESVKLDGFVKKAP